MKRSLLSTTIVGIALLLPSQATAAVFSRIYSFGDSLSDTGKVFNATGFIPPNPPYSDGRFSNGRIWTEYLKDQLGIPLNNYAFGGATTGKANTLNGSLGVSGLPGLQEEIRDFVADNPVADSNALYTIWIGANDYLPTNSPSFPPYNTPDIPLANIKGALDTLVEIGAKNLMIVNLPDLGKIPLTNNLNADGICPPNINAIDDSDCLNELTVAHNRGLLNLISSLSPKVDTFLVDVNSLVNNVIANPAQFGFTNVTDACYIFPGIPCSNSNEYLFWDLQHPTTNGHFLVGELAYKTLGIPEPLTILGTSTAFLFGAFFKKEISQRRKQNKSN